MDNIKNFFVTKERKFGVDYVVFINLDKVSSIDYNCKLKQLYVRYYGNTQPDVYVDVPEEDVRELSRRCKCIERD